MLGPAPPLAASISNTHAQEDFALPMLRVMGLLLLGVGLLSLFYNDANLPMQPAVLFLFGLTAWGIGGMKFSKGSVLTRLMIVAYALPFSALLSNVVNPDHAWWRTPRALLYINDHVLIGQMVALGSIGLVGLLLGMSAAVLPTSNRRFSSAAASPLPSASQPQSTLRPLSFIVLVALAIGLSWLSAPTKDIFTERYAAVGTQGVAQSINFNAAYLVSYVVLIILMIDAERETASPMRRKLKYQLVFVAAMFIVVVLQLLRGDRESVGLVVGLLALYVTSPHRASVDHSKHVMRQRIRKVAAPAVVLMLVFVGLGSARDRLSDERNRRINLIATLRSGLEQSTWTAVLLTNLAMAAEYRYGPMSYVYGQTYSDYVWSLPPGFVTKALGVERRLERTQGPAFWTTTVSSGGSHVLIVPFKNFGAVGVFLILAVYGFAVVRCEQLSRRGSFRGRLLFGTVTTCSLLWFWYGDLVIIRGLFAALIFGFLYQMASVRRSSVIIPPTISRTFRVE